MSRSATQIIADERLTLSGRPGVVWRSHEYTGYINGLEHLGNLQGLVTDGCIIWAKTPEGRLIDVHLDHFKAYTEGREMAASLYMELPKSEAARLAKAKAKAEAKAKSGINLDGLW